MISDKRLLAVSSKYLLTLTKAQRSRLVRQWASESIRHITTLANRKRMQLQRKPYSREQTTAMRDYLISQLMPYMTERALMRETGRV